MKIVYIRSTLVNAQVSHSATAIEGTYPSKHEEEKRQKREAVPSLP